MMGGRLHNKQKLGHYSLFLRLCSDGFKNYRLFPLNLLPRLSLKSSFASYRGSVVRDFVRQKKIQACLSDYRMTR